MTTPNTIEVEARSYELDPYGHLNNAVYVNWLEHGRLCFLRDRGLSYASIPVDFGINVVVVRQDVAFKAQVRLGDRLLVTSYVSRFGNSSFEFRQEIRFPDGRVAAQADVTMVCADGEERAQPMPPSLRDLLGT